MIKKRIKELPSVKEMERDNKRRFSSLNNYITEKVVLDTFVISGNMAISENIEKYINDNYEALCDKNKITIMDIGPATGAISTLFVFAVMEKYDLFDKCEVILLDPVEEVLMDTKNLNFPVQESLLLVYMMMGMYYLKKKGWNVSDWIERVKAKLSTHETRIIKSRAVNIPIQSESVDICISGFSFHHIHPNEKQASIDAIIKSIRPDGCFALVDEYFVDYVGEFINGKHRTELQGENDCNVIPVETPISLEEMLFMLKKRISIKIAYYDNQNYYYICGKKRVDFEDHYWVPPHLKKR